MADGFSAESIVSIYRGGGSAADLPGAVRLKGKTLGTTYSVDLQIGGRAIPVVVKERRPGPFPGGHPRRSRRAFRMGRALLAAGLPCPEPLALLESRAGAPDVLVLGRIAGAVSLRDILGGEGRDAPPAPAADRRALLASLASLLGRFHAAGFYHGDCTLKNLLAAPFPGAWSLFISDLDHACSIRAVPPPLSSLLRIHDLRDVRISGRKILAPGEFDAFLGSYAEGRLGRASRALYGFFIDLVGKRR